MGESSRKPASSPGGGAYALTGFVYQLLGSLDWATQLGFEPRELAAPNARQATMVLEPSAGGDALHEATAIQFKATTRPHWTLTQFVKEVLHDLYAAAADPRVKRFRMHTSAALGFGDDFAALLRILAAGGQLGAADEAGLKFKPPKSKSLSASAYVDWMLTTILGDKAPTKRALARLLRVLRNLDFVAEESEADLVAKIEERLARVLQGRDVAMARNTLMGTLLDAAKLGDRQVDIEALFKHCKIPIPGLAAASRAERTLADRLKIRLGELGYDPDLEARRQAPVRSGTAPTGLCGPSGVGKTWELARAARRAAQDGALVIWLDGQSRQPDVRREVAGRLAAAFEKGRLEAHQVRSTIDKMFGHGASRRVCVFLDRFASPTAAQQILSDPWWGEQGLEVVGALPAAAFDPDALPAGVLGVEVKPFGHTELRAYFKARRVDWKSLPTDMRRLLQRPILAKLYADRFRTLGDFAPPSEYALVEQAWMRPPDGHGVVWKRATGALADLLQKASRGIC